MNRRGWLSILGVVAVAAVSSLLLWRLMAGDGDLGHLGLAGVFAASMLSHLTVVAGNMFVPLFLPLASVYHPLALGAAAGVGGALGEVTTYFLGWGVAETVGPPSEAEDRIARWIRRYGLWAVLLVSITPLPDTPIVLLAGSRRLPFRRLLAVELVGKTALYSVGAVVGGLVYSGLEGSLGSVLASGLIVACSLLFCIAVTWRPSRDLIFGWLEMLIPSISE
jgi:membrane protein YqaA with SNARE-associated domain